MTKTLTRGKENGVPSTQDGIPSGQFMEVTPQMAADWLANNKTGRRLKPTQVNKIASDIRAGRWCVTGEAVKFDYEGALRDGQHRLEAVLVANIAVPMLVVGGLEPEAQLVMDTGARRTVADQLRIRGYDNTGVLAAGARLGLAWTTGQLTDRIEHLSDSAIRQFVTDNPGLMDAARFASGIRINIPHAAICVVTWRLIDMGHDEEIVKGFFRALADMNTSGQGDPKHALLHRISTARQRRERIKLTQYLSMLIRAFNADFVGDPIYKMNVLGKNGRFVDTPDAVLPVSASA